MACARADESESFNADQAVKVRQRAVESKKRQRKVEEVEKLHSGDQDGADGAGDNKIKSGKGFFSQNKNKTPKKERGTGKKSSRKKQKK